MELFGVPKRLGPLFHRVNDGLSERFVNVMQVVATAVAGAKRGHLAARCEPVAVMALLLGDVEIRLDAMPRHGATGQARTLAWATIISS